MSSDMSEMREHHNPPEPLYNDARATANALLCAVLLNVGIIGLFMFITWFAYASR